MNSNILIEKLNFQRAYKKVRLEVAHWVIEHPETFPKLLEICFKADDKKSYKAAWILELVCAEKMELLVPYFNSFFYNLPNIYQDQAVRPFSKICMMIVERNYSKSDPIITNTLKVKHKKLMIECCFDWLISNQKVATEVYAMDALYYLGTEFDWIHPELQIILEQNIPHRSAAYFSRGNVTLDKICKFRRK